MSFKIYLAGKCKRLTFAQQNEWRDYITEYMNEKTLSTIVYNPNNYFNYFENLHKTNRQVKEYFMGIIDKCDLLIVNLNDSDSSVGTGQELEHARMRGIPIIGFGTNNVYPWIAEVDCTVTFDTIEECCEYVVNYYRREDMA